MPGMSSSLPQICHTVRSQNKEARAVSESEFEGLMFMAMSKYDEIMDLPHHVSKTRPQMPMSYRAAQFAPFAALTGYDDAVKETGRLTDDKIELEESSLNELNAKIQLLRENLADGPEITFTYFKPDERKAGGAYLSTTGTVKKLMITSG